VALRKNVRVIFQRQPAVEKRRPPGGRAQAISYLGNSFFIPLESPVLRVNIPPFWLMCCNENMYLRREKYDEMGVK
jgi:hypothetical protein